MKGKSILITGGTGSLGRALTRRILDLSPAVRRLVIFSRDELKQSEMAQEFSETNHGQLRFFLGDVRDRNRLVRAFQGIDIVIHAAALKQVPAAEYNPMEFVHTNVGGAENVIEAGIDAGVSTIIALSTDKASAPINLYGATKLCSDKLFVAANSYTGHKMRSSVVRYGNVMGSRGSVIPLFLREACKGVLPITDPQMTRFNITLSEGVGLVLWAVENALGGEIFVPKIPSYRLVDLAEAIGPSCQKRITGIRPGEKIHEEMITSDDSGASIDLGEYYAIVPPSSNRGTSHPLGGEKLPHRFSYNSRDNTDFLSVEQIRKLIRDQIDSDWEPI